MQQMTRTNTPRDRSPRPARRRAFSLVELLVVIAIIALLLAIVIPALGGARDTARVSSTRALMQDFTSAASRFGLDNNDALPQYFSPAELGGADNADAGFTAMENALIAMAGPGAVFGRVSDGTPDTPDSFIKVGPSSSDDTRQAWINPGLIGSDAYFTPRAANLLPRSAASFGSGQFSDSPSNGDAQAFANVGATLDVPQMPDVVDAFGAPILLWADNAAGPSRLSSVYADGRDQFVASSTDDGSARFYLNSNAGFLRSTALGRQALDQTELSAIGADASGMFDDAARDSFMAFFGDSSFPVDIDAARTEMVASRPRGRLILHAAGPDGVYFSRNDAGYRTVLKSGDDRAYFGSALKDEGDNFLTDDSGASVSDDLTEVFDDQIVTGG
ncbi:MAG: prepilin-type N-terminal cleavage/methylation domain-containing protein [Planctomycetota bacterium]